MYYNKLSPRQISIILYILSLISWSCFIVSAELIIGKYGLIHSMGVYFFLSVILSIFSILISLKYDSINSFFSMQILLLYAILYVTPYFLEKTASFTYSYLVYGYMEYILRMGYINPQILPYQNWPGIMFFGAFFTQISDLGRSQFLVIYPIALKIISLILIYYIYYMLSKNKLVARVGILVYLLGDWTAHQYYTPPSFSIVLYMLSLFLISGSLFIKGKNSYQWRILILLASCSMIITHLLSSIILFLLAFASSIYAKLSNKMSIGNLFFVILIILFAWNILQVGDYFTVQFTGAFSNFNNAKEIVESTERSSLGTPEAHVNVMHFKILYLAIFSVLATLSIIYSIIDKQRRKSQNITILIAFLFSITIITPLSVGSYGGEILSRAFGYDAVLLAFLIACNWDVKIFNILIIMFLIISPFFFIICSYGNEVIDYVSPQEIAGVDYYYSSNFDRGPILSIGERIWSSRYIEETRWKRLYIDNPLNSTRFVEKNQGYVAFYDRSIEGYEFFVEPIDEFSIKNILNYKYHNIYSSAGFDLFKVSG